MHVIVVIPAYNESRTIGAVIEGCKLHADEVIVVDDGSYDNTALIAEQSGTVILRHLVNRGYGAALKTGMMAALQRNADVVVTIDADGQHEPAEIPKLVKPLVTSPVIASERSERGDLSEQEIAASPRLRGAPRNDQADIVIGDRFGVQSKREGMSFLRKILITSGNILTWILYGVWLHDTQSGFRAYTRGALERLRMDSEGMEFSSEVIGEAVRSGLRVALVPITVRYTDYSLGKGQNFFTGIRTALQLLLRRFFK